MFADYHAENKDASMGAGSILYFFCAITYMLIILFTGISPAYRLLKSWFRHNGLPLSDALLIFAWIVMALTLSGFITLLVCKRGITALKPG